MNIVITLEELLEILAYAGKSGYKGDPKTGLVEIGFATVSVDLLKRFIDGNVRLQDCKLTQSNNIDQQLEDEGYHPT